MFQPRCPAWREMRFAKNLQVQLFDCSHFRTPDDSIRLEITSRLIAVISGRRMIPSGWKSLYGRCHAHRNVALRL
jgi:hypothetical protein